jgi:hypothetical protein
LRFEINRFGDTKSPSATSSDLTAFGVCDADITVMGMVEVENLSIHPSILNPSLNVFQINDETPMIS